MKNPLSVAVLALASSIFIFSSTCQSQTYQLTDLGSSVGTNSYAQGINNAGQVVGYWETTNGAHAFLYQRGVVTDLGLLGNLGSNNYALSINNSGQIVGFSLTTNGAVAFVCQQGTNTSLGTFGALGSYAFGINDHGQIVGHVDTGGGANAFLFDNGAVTSLGTLGGTNSFAYGVNNSLQVAGASLLADNFTTHAFLWQNSVISDLNQLLSDGSGWELVEAHGINDSGSIAGWGLTNGQQHAFIYYGSGWAQDLGTLAGGTNSYALGLNNSNQVVGGASYASATHAALWQSGTILDLNNLIAIPGWDLREATGINDLGQMVGWGITNGQVHAFLLLPKDFVSVVILSPVSNAVVRSGSSISLSASAASSQGSVIKVQFYQGKSALATITNAPFATLWNKPAAGKYVLTARATDSLGLVATSSVVTVTVDVPPTVTLTNPANNSLIAPGTDVTLAASAASTNGAIAQVQFFQGTNLLGGVTNAPYSLTWSNVPAGPYQLRAVATDNDGLTTTSAVVSVLVDVAPSVTLTNPANGTLVRYGSNVSLGANIVAPDGTIIKVQFFRGASALATLTNAPYVATWSKPAAGSYALTARATDNFGLATTSSIVTVTVDIPPTVTLTNPANKAVIAPGTDVTLAASATSTNGTVAQVQFFQGTNLLGGVANAPFTLIWSNAPVGAYKLSAVATDNDGLTTTSAVVAVLVDASPTVTVTNPAIDAVVRYGSNISLGANVESAGGAITKVQFLQGTSTLATLTNAPYAATWTKPAVGNYVLSARATDNLGLISTSAPVPVFVVKTIGVPVVIGQPTNQTVIQGANVALNVVVSSTSLTPSYQWFFNANPLAGATNTSLAILNIQTNNAGIYSVAITNSLGGVTSSNALLTVLTPPSIATQPANQTTSLGGTAAFTVVATGTAPLSYQWYFNGTNQLAGATNSTLTVTNIQMTNAGNYSVTITNVVGEVTSANALLNVSGLPTITIQSTNQIVAQGSKVILGVTVSGPGPFNYQWLFNGTNLPPIITTVAGNGNAGYGGDNGAATLANLNNPSGVAVDAYGDLFIADSGNSVIREVNTNGIIWTVAGDASAGYGGDGYTATNANLNNPSGVAVDAYGDLFIADSGNSVIREVDTNGNIWTVAGDGGAGYGGDGYTATSANLNNPTGVAVDAYGDLFIADSYNSVIREVDTNGNIWTVAGNGGTAYGGDGYTATSAYLNNPSGVAVDAYGDLFIADSGNSVIREVNTNGIISTVAGNGNAGYAGDGYAATSANLNNPTGVAVDAFGNLFIVDKGNNVIREVDTNGFITTVVGNGSPGYTGDGGAAINATLDNPSFLAVDSGGNLSIADTLNNVIRAVSATSFTGQSSSTLTLYNLAGSNSGNYNVIICNLDGCITNAGASLTVLAPPGIISQPASYMSLLGSNVFFSVTASGAMPLNYQWYFNGTNLIAGATNSSLALLNVQAADTGSYSVAISNQVGGVISSGALLAIRPPMNLTLAVGGERLINLTNGDVISLGGNQFGDLGDYTHISSTNQVHVVGLTNVTAIASGLLHSLAIDSTQALWAWGDNQYGQLGNGTTNATNLPIPVLGMGSNVVAAAGSDETSIAVKTDGTVWVWGTFQTGSGSDVATVTLTNATQVSGLANAIAVSAGKGFFLALLSDGTVWAWGANDDGELGNGTFSYSSGSPAQVLGISNIVAMCNGFNHCLALDASGQVWAWGQNANGQVGDVGNYASVPVLVFSNAVQIAAGNSHSLALDPQGDVWAWGSDSAGQLGDAGSENIYAPTEILSLGNIVSIAAGSDASLAVDSAGNRWQWGASDGGLSPGAVADPVWNGNDGYPQLTPTYVNFYNGQLPDLQILGANNQTGHGGFEFAQPLVFQVTDTNGFALSNAPVSVEVISGDMELRTVTGGTNFQGLRLTTDVNGQVSLIGFADANPVNTNCLVRVLAASRAQIAEVDFNATLVPPPSITITNPTDGSGILVGINQSLTLSVDAEATPGFPIKEVDYYYGTNGIADTLLAVSTSSPYSFTWTDSSCWTNAFNGQYTISAVVVDTANAKSESQSVGINLALDSDGIGIPDYWQLEYFGYVGVDPNSSPDGTGQSILYDYQNGLDPTDFYNGNRPVMQLLNGNNQVGNYASFLAQPVTIEMLDANANILTNVPVSFTVSNGTALLAASTNDLPVSLLSLRTDTNGQASVWVYFPPATSNPPDSTIWVTTPSGTNPVSITVNEYLPLARWTFNNTNTWIGEAGQLPLFTNNLAGVPSWSGNAVVVDNPNEALLAYNVVETNDAVNIYCQTGSVLFYFKPDWSSADQGGTGPGCSGRLIEMGDYNPAFTNGWWSLYLSPDGTQIMFATSTNGGGMTNLSASVSLTSNVWYQIGLAYSPTGSTLFVDGQSISTGSGVIYSPSADELTNGFAIGSDQEGNNQAQGTFDELETFADPLTGIGPAVDTYWFGIPDYKADPNGTLGAWELAYFGYIGLDPNGSIDNDGTNNLQAFLTGMDPNIINFSFTVTNHYVDTNIVTGVFTIMGGSPSSMAVLVDDTNLAAASWLPYGSNLTINLGSTPGPHDVWVGLRGLPSFAQPTWQETTLVLDTNSSSILITSPADNICLNSKRINIGGNFTSASIRQIAVNGVLAYVNGTNFEAINLPLIPGTNFIVAIIQDLAGGISTNSIRIIGMTNSDGSMNEPLLLQASPVAGFEPLQVTFQIQTNAPGQFQQVSYDFVGDDIPGFVTNSLGAIGYTYATNGEFFPVATIQTDVGRFSSSGGWNDIAFDPTNPPVEINVKPPLTMATFASIIDPVALKWTGTNLYVLSGNTATITEFDTNGNAIGCLTNLGANPSGFDVDGGGNVYVAVTSSNQVWKFCPTNGSFQADGNFGNNGCVGLNNGISGTNNAEFNAPFAVAVSPDGGTISVSDLGNNRVQLFDANGNFSTSFGSFGVDMGQFNMPKGLTYDSDGNLYIVDSGNNRIVLAQDFGVVGLTGSGGTALGQFNNAINISVGKRGVYVADAGNDRIDSFSPGTPHNPFSIDWSAIRFALATNLSAPAAVAAVDNLTNELFYVADTGNNRILLCNVPTDSPGAILSVWNAMSNHVANGDIAGAISYFSVAASDQYQRTFLSVGTGNTSSAISQIGTLTPVYIFDDRAEYYFTNEIGGQIITFPVQFDKENGVWKILEF